MDLHGRHRAVYIISVAAELAGVKRVLALEARVAELEAELTEARQSSALVPLRQEVVVYRQQRRED